MSLSFYLDGNIHSVSAAFADIVSTVVDAANWTLTWSGSDGASPQHALVRAEESAISINQLENQTNAICGQHGVRFVHARV